MLFREYYDIPNVDFADIEYEKACNSDAVQSVLNTTGSGWDETSFLTAPMGAAIRIAEGYDSLRNLAISTKGNTTEIERASMILCGMAQLGGLLFTVLCLSN